MPTPVIPVLMNDIGKLQKPTDIIKHVLRWYVYIPKNINDTFADQEISLRYDDAEVGGDPELLKERVRIHLTNTLTRYFPGANSVDVSVSIETVDDARYSLVIDISVFVDGVLHSVSDNFTIDKNGNLQYIFRG